MPYERRLATFPVLRSDGTVLQRPGFDVRSGMIYQPDADYPAIHESSSLPDALAHRDALLDLVTGWSFATPHHRSAWLASLLTCIARPVIDGPCPLFVLDAQEVGMAKTSLVRLTSSLAFGREPGFLSPPLDEEAFDRRTRKHLNERAPAIVLDNIAEGSALPLESLLSALMSTSWHDLPNRAVWWLTGNRLTLPARLWERSLRIELRPIEGSARSYILPSVRDPKWRQQGRPVLLCAALSLVRRYIAEAWRRPDAADRTSTDFRAWMSFIPGLFQWLDLPDPMQAREI